MTPEPRYPIYVISKGRWKKSLALTAAFLKRDRVRFRLVVEPQEADLYADVVADNELLVLPFSNLGLGSIPARNWVWEHSKEEGHDRHWILDDNILDVRRMQRGYRIPCNSGPAFAAIEDFTDRYENVGIAGMNYQMFGITGMPPFYLNVHVYSCMLIRNDLPYRWRGRYNEDTDLCLQVLSGGLCTLLFNVFLADKQWTMKMGGGNTDELYAGDGRLKMARSLERAWPGVVETKRKFRRPQHHVKDNWKRFDTPLKLKPGVDLGSLPETDEYGLELRKRREIKSDRIQRLYEQETARQQTR